MKNIPQHYSLESFHKLIGISHEKMDCYEIVIEFYKQVLGLKLESIYDIRPEKEEVGEMVKIQKEKFEKVSLPQFGDIILFSIYDLPCHIGIYIDKKTFFHSREKAGSILDKLDIWNKRIIGYYRWPK